MGTYNKGGREGEGRGLVLFLAWCGEGVYWFIPAKGLDPEKPMRLGWRLGSLQLECISGRVRRLSVGSEFDFCSARCRRHWNF